LRFVHYTSADSAQKIIASNEVLLRDSQLMNDFSEVRHGAACLREAWHCGEGERLKTLLAEIHPELPSRLEASYNQTLPAIVADTYLISVSEHHAADDEFGKLSMWRAYAPKDGIALVFHNAPFVTESDALGTYASPVVYRTPGNFRPLFKEVVDSIDGELAELRKMDPQFTHNWLLGAFVFAVQSTKHPAFEEEQEWRVIYSPPILQGSRYWTEERCKRVPVRWKTLNGIPQRTYALPFADYPNEQFTGATLPALLDRVMVGPSRHADIIKQAIGDQLQSLGMSNPHISVTGIPLRV
jgi:hypothetical protein